MMDNRGAIMLFGNSFDFVGHFHLTIFIGCIVLLISFSSFILLFTKKLEYGYYAALIVLILVFALYFLIPLFTILGVGMLGILVGTGILSAIIYIFNNTRESSIREFKIVFTIIGAVLLIGYSYFLFQ